MSNQNPLLHNSNTLGSSKKGKKSSRRQSDKIDKSASEKEDHNKHLNRPRRTTSDTSIEKSDDADYEQEEKVRVSGQSLKSTRSRGPKEDKRPSVPRRVSDARERDDNSVDKPSSGRSLGKKLRQKDTSSEKGLVKDSKDKLPTKPGRERDDNSVDKPSSGRSLGKKLRQKDASSEKGLVKDSKDKLPTKPGRRTTRRVSPDSKSDDDDDLNVGSFHSLRKDSDKPRRRSRSNTSKKRTPNSARRNKTPTSGKVHRRKLKDKSSNNSDDTPLSNDTETSDDMDENGTQQICLKDEESSTPGSTRVRRERRKDRERLGVNGDARKMKTNSFHGSRMGRSSLSARREGMRRSHSERWNREVETLEAEGAENPPVVKRRIRANDGLSRSAHSKVRRNNSSGLSRMKGSLNNRSYHGVESDRRPSSDGRRTPSRRARRQKAGETFNSVGDDSIESFGDAHSFGDGRSQATLESIEDFEDFGEDFYGMEMQTPGMVDFEEEMLDLMQRANPEVTDHLDRRVHRKREMVAYDHNMPMMTRQALLTRQASSQVQRQFFDGSNIDKNRLLLRNDSMTSNNSSHRAMRSTHGRRAPPRAKSSGLGAMGRGGYMETDDRRRSFRSGSSQTASFNQYSLNKPNKVRNLNRRASGDLVGPRPRSGEHRRRPVQRAASTTAIKRASSTDHAAPVRSEWKMSDDRLEEDKDMSNKRNRSKLHFLMYMTKMSVNMDDLFKRVREGEKPRLPIDSLRMPSP